MEEGLEFPLLMPVRRLDSEFPVSLKKL